MCEDENELLTEMAMMKALFIDVTWHQHHEELLISDNFFLLLICK